MPERKEVERIAALRREAERLVRELFAPDQASASTAMRVVADTYSDADRYVIEVELPGVHPGQLQLFSLGDSLIVEGRKERPSPTAGRPVYERAERDYGAFRRVIDLPGPGDLSRITATLKDGLLTIVVPGIDDRRGRPTAIAVDVQGDSE